MMQKVTRLYTMLKRNALLSFTLGGICAWALGKWLDNLFQTSGIPGIVTLTLSVLGAVLLFHLVRFLLRWILPEPKIFLGTPPPQQQGLITLYSKNATLFKAIEYHHEKLTHLWLVVTPESQELAQKTMEELALSYTKLKVYMEPTATAWNPDDTALAVQRALTHAADESVRKADLICDITGGTKTMTIGAMVTCMAERVRTQMVPGEYGKNLTVKKPLEVIEVQL